MSGNKSPGICVACGLLTVISATIGIGAGKAERFEDIRERHVPFLLELEPKHHELCEAWEEVRGMQDRAAALKQVFGLKKRRSALKKLGILESKISREKQQFKKLYDKARGPLCRQEADLKKRAARLESKSAPEDEKNREELSQVYDKARPVTEKLFALEALKLTIDDFSLPDDLDLLGIPESQGKLRGAAAACPDIVEARLVIKDCQADIKEISGAESGKQQSPVARRIVATARARLDQAVAALEKAAVVHKLPVQKEIGKLQTKIDSIKKRIESREKRGQSTDLYTRQLSELDKQTTDLQAKIDSIDDLSKWE